MVDWTSQAFPVAVAFLALGFAALTWLESRKKRQLLETLVKSVPLISVARPRRREVAPRGVAQVTREPKPTIAVLSAPVTSKPGPAQLALPRPKDAAKALAEERRRLELELKRERLQ